MSAAPYAPGPELDAALVELERLWNAAFTIAAAVVPQGDTADSTPGQLLKRAQHLSAIATDTPRLIATIRAQAVRERVLLDALERLAPGTRASVTAELDRAVASFLEGNAAQSPTHRVRKQILLSQLVCPSCAKTGIQSVMLDGYDRGWPTFKTDHFDGRKCQGVAPTDWLGIEIKAGP